MCSMADVNVCFVCDKVFQQRATLYSHIRKKHATEPNTEGTIKCPQDDCPFAFNVLASLRAHVQEKHMVAVVKESIVFQSMDEFQKWKLKEEKAASSSFVMQGGAKRVRDGTKFIYVCHRSGIFTSQSKGKRLLKSQGSNKIGSHCTAAIELTRDKNGICSVFYIKTHFGHELNVGFLRLSRPEKEAIASKIAEGVTFERILDDVRDCINSEEVERLHLLTRKDLHNIKKEFGIVHQCHANDDISVSIFLETIKDCVLIYKKVGEDVDNLSVDDTMIVLMSDLQCEMLKKFGPNIVCVDSTHCTNIQKLLITTLLVIDEFGCGIPVAFCLSNKETTDVMTTFFTCIREKSGVIQSKVFMSDDTNTFRCAWARVMGLAENNLLCAWHVDRSWRNNLKKVRGGPNKQTQVYKALRMLLEEASVENFGELLVLFEKELQEDEETREFGSYFTNNYGFRPQHWAYCYRRSLNINTNMHLEAMHRVLKYCYLGGNTNNRLDKLLLMIVKLTRDKFFDRIVKLCKGGHSHRLQQIQERHRESKHIDESQITANNVGKEFYVKSQSINGITYTVTLQSLECNLNCRLSCFTCGICIHSFSCCCPDNLINLNMCKHIHAVSTKYALHSSKAAKQVESTSVEEATAILSTFKKQNEDEIAPHRAQLKATLNVLTSHVDSLDMETVGTVQKEVDRLLSLVSSSIKREGPRLASNEKVKVQRISHKRNTCQKSMFAKPTLAEKSNVAGTLKQPDGEVLAVHVDFDHTYCKK